MTTTTTCSAALAGTTLLLTFDASGALIFQNFSDLTLTTDGTSQAFLDFETMTLSTTSNGDTDYTLRIFDRSFTPDSTGITGSGSNFDGGSVQYGILGNNRFALNLSLGDVIGGLGGSNLGSGGEFFSNGALLPGTLGATISGGEIGTSAGISLNPLNNFAEGDSGYLGLVRYTFDDGDNLTETHYGFLEVEVGSLTIKSGGWETVSNPTAGVTVVPETSSMALLALGLGGMMGYRRREATAR